MRLKRILIIGTIFPVLFSIVLFFGILISGEDDDSSNSYSPVYSGMNLSADVLKHQPMVEKYARENGISEYVNVLLAIIQVESGGTATDVMQSSESLGLPPNSLSTEESIKQGCKYFASLLSSCKAKGMNDINVVIQSYNYGGEQTQAVTENYTVTVYVDKDGAMVITQNPTLAPAVQKSKYEPKVQEADVSVSSDTVKDATAFLETFFKLYPTATEKELAYYVKNGVLAPVSGDYVFSELVNPVFTKDGDNLKVSVSVKYLDNKSKMTQISQYELVLHKDDNWKIVE